MRRIHHHSFMIHGSLVPINLSNVDKFAYRGKGRAWSLCAIDATLVAASYIVYIRVVNTYTRISTYKVRRRIKTRKLWNTKRGAVAGRVASTKSQYLGLKWRNWNLLLNHLSAAPFKLADLPFTSHCTRSYIIGVLRLFPPHSPLGCSGKFRHGQVDTLWAKNG